MVDVFPDNKCLIQNDSVVLFSSHNSVWELRKLDTFSESMSSCCNTQKIKKSELYLN